MSMDIRVSTAAAPARTEAGRRKGQKRMKVDIPVQGKVIARYGLTAQAMVHMEECAELTQAISKMNRAREAGINDTDARFNLVEEMADVLICMEQIQEIYNIRTLEIQEMIIRKCRRQDERL